MKKTLRILTILLLFSASTKAQLDSLLSFNGTNGAMPNGSLISDGTYLYGMTSEGGTNNYGTIFKVKIDGTGFNTLLNFNATNGAIPDGSLISDGTYLYGMTSSGGTHSRGNIFKIKTDGTGFDTLLNFSIATGSQPHGSLISDGTYLYGMTSEEGPQPGQAQIDGTIFKIKTDGTGFNILLSFNGTNGAGPLGSLISDGTYLYGMTYGGNIFKVKTDGTGYVDLYNFPNQSMPYGSLISDGTYLYGMSQYGGTDADGVLFKIKTDGTGYTDLYNFGDGIDAIGENPLGSLISDGTYLYGMITGENTQSIFKIKPNGTYLTGLGYLENINMQTPYGDLLLLNNELYGMANGGSNGHGGIFKCSTSPLATSLNFDGVDDYVSVADNAALDFGTNDFTIEASFQSSVSQPDYSGIVAKSAGTGNPNNGGYQLLIVGNKLAAKFTNSNGDSLTVGNGLQSTSYIVDGTWHHLAMVVSRTTNNIKLLVDGNVEANITNTIVATANVTNTAENMLLGVDASYTNYVLGNIDEVRIWNRALCATEIHNNLNGELPPAAQVGLVAYYKFNEGFYNIDNTAITNVADSSGNAFNGAFHNFALTGPTSNFVAQAAVNEGSIVTPFINTVATQTNVTCNNLTSGVACVSVSNYTAYTYAWSTGNTTDSIITGLTPGNYTCTVSGSCGAVKKIFTITQPTQPIITYTLTQDNVPHTWDVYPTYPANVATYSWDWGDGSPFATTQYPNHTYATPGKYNICLTITDANGCSATTCQNDTVYRLVNNNTASSNMVYVNVLSPATIGITTFNTQQTISIYPNPAQNSFTIETNTSEKQMIFVFDVNGNLVLNQFIQNKTTIDASTLNAGVYNVSITNAEGTINKRLVIVK